MQLLAIPKPIFIPKVRCIYFINPHNPYGVVYNQKEIDAIDTVRRKYSMVVIEDLALMEVANLHANKQGYFSKSNQRLYKHIILISPSKAYEL